MRRRKKRNTRDIRPLPTRPFSSQRRLSPRSDSMGTGRSVRESLMEGAEAVRSTGFSLRRPPPSSVWKLVVMRFAAQCQAHLHRPWDVKSCLGRLETRHSERVLTAASFGMAGCRWRRRPSKQVASCKAMARPRSGRPARPEYLAFLPACLLRPSGQRRAARVGRRRPEHPADKDVPRAGKVLEQRCNKRRERMEAFEGCAAASCRW